MNIWKYIFRLENVLRDAEGHVEIWKSSRIQKTRQLILGKLIWNVQLLGTDFIHNYSWEVFSSSRRRYGVRFLGGGRRGRCPFSWTGSGTRSSDARTRQLRRSDLRGQSGRGEMFKSVTRKPMRRPVPGKVILTIILFTNSYSLIFDLESFLT